MKNRKDFLETKPEIGQTILWWHCQDPKNPTLERFSRETEWIDGDTWMPAQMEVNQ